MNLTRPLSEPLALLVNHTGKFMAAQHSIVASNMTMLLFNSICSTSVEDLVAPPHLPIGCVNLITSVFRLFVSIGCPARVIVKQLNNRALSNNRIS